MENNQKNQGNTGGELSGSELVKLRYNYAWNWFDFHAKQRVSMFNYLLIITGIFANALISVIRTDFYYIAVALGILGIITCVAFFCLDIRNKQLVEMGEDVLLNIEEEIFSEQFKIKRKEKPKDDKPLQGGFMLREYLGEPRWEKGSHWSYIKANAIKHKFVIRFIELIVAVAFLLGILMLFCLRPERGT